MLEFFLSQLKKLLLLAVLMLSLAPGLALADGSGLCDKISQGTGGFFSCGTSQTTFTDFKGGLTAPDTSGYDKGLVQTTNIRDYIKNVVNFVLGFLGIISIVIIIYGGFLYVTAAGKEEQAGKGKKAITYALVGILIILGSFAIVNTILQAPSGTENSTLNGSALNSVAEQNANRRAFFNYAAVAVQTIARDFVTAYQNYSEINIDITALADTSNEKIVKSPVDLKSVLQAKKNILNVMLVKAGALSQIAEKASNGIAVLDGYLQTADQKITEAATKDADTWSNFWNNKYNDYKAEIENKFQGGFTEANKQDFAQAVIKAHDKLEDLYTRINAAASLPEVTGAFDDVFHNFQKLVSSLTVPTSTTAIPVKVVSFANFLQKLQGFFVQTANAAEALPTLSGRPDNAMILEIVNALGKLYDTVKDVQFVYAVINADVNEGNAPLIVNFDALRSADPNNHTLKDSDFTWDFSDGTELANCPQTNSKNGSTISHTFCTPGSYIVKLTVKAPKADTAKGENQAADGVAWQTIVVHQPSSRISLKVSTTQGKEPFILSAYNDQGFQTVNVQTITVTTTEAKNGLIFDAGDTKTGNGKPFKDLPKTGAAKVRWDFGDKSNANTIVDGPPDTISQTQKIIYAKEGAYRITLEVTDDRGITDRKIFNVIISSLAARINVQPGNNGKLGDEFSFDGSASASDNGQAITYQWAISKEAGADGQQQDLTPPELKTADNLHFKFLQAGKFNVSLSVNDGSKDASADAKITIESKPPVAQFNFSNADKTQPNTYILDGSKSFDPDGREDLEYKWEVNAPPGDCQFLDNGIESDCKTAFKDFSADRKFIKPKVRLKKGTYTVTLDVNDPAEPGKSTPQEQQIVVDNDLDVGWSDDGKPLTSQLKTGVAEVSFPVKTLSGVSYELDTGDGSKENGKISGIPTIVKHTYSQAGAFQVKLSVFDASDNENSTIRKLFIASSDTPVAAISVSMNGDNIADTSALLTSSRQDIFTFDAGKSLNTDGTSRHLTYSWDFGDGQKSTKKQVTHTFTELTPKGTNFYRITLRVGNETNPSQLSQVDEVHINVIPSPPSIRGLTAVPVNGSGNLATPVTVNVSAVGAADPDGKIVSFRWWYYNVDSPEDQLGLQITQSPSTTLVIGTNGEEGVKKTYAFAVAVTDDENQIFNSKDVFNEKQIPALTVINGPNKAPIAKFSVDRTSIMVGDTINFSSSSYSPDPSGSIVKYIWDFNGNGFGDEILKNENNQANVSYTYTSAHKDGVRVKLKVINNNGAEAVSDPVTIYVDGKSAPPVAAFTSSSSQELEGKKMQFTNNSTVDSAGGATVKNYQWDFDLSKDSNGDGKKDNDVDSIEANPVYEYPDYGIYRAKLTVTDDQGNSGFITNFVNVKAPAGSGANTNPVYHGAASTSTATSAAPVSPASTQSPRRGATQGMTTISPAEILEARLTSAPQTNVADGRIHLQGDKGTVIFNFVDSKGDIKSYIIDKNIYYDADGNGVREDDEDYKTAAPGTWATEYLRSYGQIRARLTVVSASGKKDSVEKDIVFDAPGGKNKKAPNPLGTNVFAPERTSEIAAVLVTLGGFVIVMLGLDVLKNKKRSRHKK